MKVCYRCKIEKPDSDFTPVKKDKSKDGLYSYCRKCASKITMENLKKNPDSNHRREKTGRAWRLKKNFNLTLKDYDKMFESQKGLCAICGLPETSKSKTGKTIRLSVDHNHNTGKIRGLLCDKCNRAIGALRVDGFGILNLQMTIKYLEDFNGTTI